VRGAALVVVAAPPAATRELLARMKTWLAPGALVTDVASVKRSIVASAIAGGLADQFAGSHPLAGTHAAGFAAASPDLLHRAVVYVCATGTLGGDNAARAISGFWRRVAEAEPVLIGAEAHDTQLAWTSHLPQAVASTLARALSARRLGGVSFGTGARDTTRLAASDPALWVDILLENAAAVGEALAATGAELDRLRSLLAAQDASGLRAFLDQGASFRRALER
jgi:prephenate dehydrogenase